MGNCKQIKKLPIEEEVQIIKLPRIEDTPNQQSTKQVSLHQTTQELVQQSLEKKQGYAKLNINGCKYEGFFRDDKFHGFGKYTLADQSYYEGSWENGSANGQGTFCQRNGITYKGVWKNNKQNGIGQEMHPGKICFAYKDGTCYDGYFINGMKEVSGFMKYPDGSTYQGDFKNDLFNGYGVYTWEDQRKYVGQWWNNQMHGKGVFSWADGRVFDGNYRNGKKWGFGIYELADKRKFVGKWKDGSPCGLGQLIKGNEVIYGEWRDGEFTPNNIKELISRDFDEVSECLSDCKTLKK